MLLNVKDGKWKRENGILFSVGVKENESWLRATAALKNVEVELEGQFVKSHAQSRRLYKHLTRKEEISIRSSGKHHVNDDFFEMQQH